MKAFYCNAYGGPEVMAFGEVPDPRPGKGEVVVQVMASSVNPVDWKVRGGTMRVLSGLRFPKVLGCDLAGVVQEVGRGVSTLRVGDRVYGYTPMMFGKPGAHAERVAARAQRLRRLPEGLDFQQAAALPVAALTAWDGLRKCGDLHGREVIVNGATGGVGHLALQLAKARGAVVTAVCSGRNAERARALGADAVIDYKTEDFTRGARRYDVVFDAHGKLGFAAAQRVLTPHGLYITTLGTPLVLLHALWRRLRGGPRIALANMRDRLEDYAVVESLVLDGRVKPLVQQVLPLERAAEAFATQEGGGTVGKLVLRIGE